MRNIRRSKGVPGPVAALLDLVMPRGAEEKLALPGLRDKWASAVGPMLAKKTWPDDIEKGVLLVKADSPSSAKALSMRGASVAREASKISGVKVTAVKVVVGKTSPPPRAGKRGKPALVKPKKEDVDRAFEEVKEKFSPERENLARRFASLMTLYRMRFPDK
ncbi:uncharacterized protein DUF721 [Aminivibrio pyruvatiphilus]|jgi:hypothetical protein|uniref:Uncharacterized protein DUF721 n=1 Tax=Aminivibrio pyruvatiphilus TaxID=1005740 RepID=A0A4R8M686_9BACT|nr:DciA family protein [Aminivibrio pyruvatiphilus]TDY60853.1 uncharacterized protein DUF721 [Aminivibrio pyruvatiphilus]